MRRNLLVASIAPSGVARVAAELRAVFATPASGTHDPTDIQRTKGERT